MLNRGENRQTNSFQIKNIGMIPNSSWTKSYLKPGTWSVSVEFNMTSSDRQGQHQSKRITTFFSHNLIWIFFIQKALLITFNESSELRSVFAFNLPTTFSRKRCCKKIQLFFRNFGHFWSQKKNLFLTNCKQLRWSLKIAKLRLLFLFFTRNWPNKKQIGV